MTHERIEQYQRDGYVDDGYNGWANWETWSTSLYLDNDQAIYYFSRQQAKMLDKDEFEEWITDFVMQELREGPTLARELLQSAVNRIDFEEIRTSLLEEEGA